MSARSAYARQKATDKARTRRPSQPNHQDYGAIPHQTTYTVSQGVVPGMPLGLPPGMMMVSGAQPAAIGVGAPDAMGTASAALGMGTTMSIVGPGAQQDYGAQSVGTGVPTMNGRFLKFSAPTGPSISDQQTAYSAYGAYGGSVPGRGTSTMPTSRGSGSNSPLSPVDEFGMVRSSTAPYQQTQRKPTLETVDMSGIEKSGFRSLVDKRSEDVRRGIAKTFTFSRKSKSSKADSDRASDKSDKEHRPSSALRNQSRASSFMQKPSSAHTPDLVQLQRAQSQPQFSAVPMPISPLHGQFPQLSPPMPPYHYGQNGQNMQIIQNTHPHYPQHDHHNSIGGGQSQPPQANYQGVWDGYPTSPPSARLPPTPQGQTPPVKRWVGSGRPVQPWNKLRKDPELWDPNGDVLIYLAHRDQHPRPPASFRLSSHIIEATESRPLITLLREGSIEEDLNRMPPAGPFGMVASGVHAQPTPPLSESASLNNADGQISYEIFLPAPQNLDRTQRLRHQIATRNTFALLYHASLVGTSLHQALTDLHARLDSYMSPESDILADMINYVCARGIDDVRADPESAIGLLAWAESPEVRWEDGWRECFVHCVGMFPSLERCVDYVATTPITRALLERAFLETRMRVHNAEERLAEFHFDDMWPVHMPAVASQGHAAAARLQRFLHAHYSRTYGRWPPPPGHLGPTPTSSSAELAVVPEDGVWLNRAVAQALQKDFAALYDYLVNRDIVWDVSEARSGRKHLLVSASGNGSFEADLADVPMTDMLVEFDNRMQFPHMPHPYPLVPESITPALKEPPSIRFSFGSASRKSSTPSVNSGGSGGGSGTPANLERRIQLAYTEATNIYSLGSDFVHSDLIESFARFEKSDQVGEVDPAVARRGRWVLVYGILQMLASVSVDAPHVRYSDSVPYHLSPRLKGATIPPWKSGQDEDGDMLPWQDTGHEDSHCWVVIKTWKPTGNQSRQASRQASRGEGPRAQSPSRQRGPLPASLSRRPVRAPPRQAPGYSPSTLSVSTTQPPVEYQQHPQQPQQPQRHHQPHPDALAPQENHLSPSTAASPRDNRHAFPHPDPSYADNFRDRSSSVASGATFGGEPSPTGPLPPLPSSAADFEHVVFQQQRRPGFLPSSDQVSEPDTPDGTRCYTPSALSVRVSGVGYLGINDGQDEDASGYEDRQEEDGEMQRLRRMMGRM